MAMIDKKQMLPKGTVLGDRYRVVRYLASGGFGNTYVAEHVHLGEQVAVKEFFMRGINNRSVDGTTVEVSNATNIDVFNSQLEKFRREARRIFKLHNDHIIHVTDLFDANGTSYYIMDLINGTSLAEQVKSHPLPEDEARDVILQVLDALESMHSDKLYHLDVKPGNIMRDSSGHCILIDFGASKQRSADEGGTLSSSSMAYTPGYAPLEQIQQNSRSIGPWTDFFSLGATLYSLITGCPPPLVDVYDTAPNGRNFHYPIAVSPNLRIAISTLMNPNLRLRPQTALEVRTLLDNVPSPPLLPPEPPVENEKTRLDRQDSGRSIEETTQKEQKNSSRINLILQNLVQNMVEVEGGTFMMGEKYSLFGGIGADNKAHEVTLSSFAIGRTQVTQKEWQAVMGNNPSHFRGDNLPVESVSWEDCQEFIHKLNELTKDMRPEGRDFRLPTEAEWEFAARGGVRSKGYAYSRSNNLDLVAWYDSGGKTHIIAQKQANELGLYDMSGNVWEWCEDWYGHYSSSAQKNPKGPSSGFRRVDRGGSWIDDARSCRVSHRDRSLPGNRRSHLGLRLAR